MSIALEVRVFPSKDPKHTGHTKATASVGISVDGAKLVCIRNIRVIEGKDKGLFVSMPQLKGTDGKYYDIAFPLDKNLRDHMSDAVLAEYNAVKENANKNTLENGLKTGAQRAASQVTAQNTGNVVLNVKTTI